MIGDIVFVHIPKTAGTAFREALVAATPDAVHLYDYGPQAPLTSQAIRDARYTEERRGRPHFRDLLPTGRPLVVSGHFLSSQYARNFAANSFITFLRDPVARTLSEFKHVKRVQGYAGSLREFCETPVQRNKQTRFLRNVDLPSFLFVGLVERYAEDVAALSELTGLRLQHLRSNVAPERQKLALGQDDEKALAGANAEDMELYEWVKAMRAGGGWRPRSPQGPIKAEAAVLPGGDIEGWAVAESGQQAVTLTVSAGGREVGLVKCDAYRPDLQSRKLSKTGIGGFRFSPKALGIERGPVSLAAPGWACEVQL